MAKAPECGRPRPQQRSAGEPDFARIFEPLGLLRPGTGARSENPVKSLQHTEYEMTCLRLAEDKGRSLIHSTPGS